MTVWYIRKIITSVACFICSNNTSTCHCPSQKEMYTERNEIQSYSENRDQGRGEEYTLF